MDDLRTPGTGCVPEVCFVHPALNDTGFVLEIALRKIVVAAIVFFIPFFAVFNFIMNHFYVHGAYMFDSGLFSYIMWRNSAWLSLPPLVGGHSYYMTHASPLLAIVSLPTYFLNWHHPVFFSAWQGVIYGILALAAFVPLTAGLRNEWRLLLLAGGVSLAFALGGISLPTIAYPHFEPVIAALALFFFYYWYSDRRLLAAVFFVLTLLAREDAGFHLTAVLAVVVVFRWWDGRPLRAQKADIGITLIAFLASLAALAVQSTFFPGDTAIRRVYFGEDFYAHLTPELLAARVRNFVFNRLEIFLPMVISLLVAIYARNKYAFVGFLAYFPWLALHLTARADAPGDLFAYYAYPFLISVAWPAIGLRLGNGSARLEARHLLIPICAALVVSPSAMTSA